jgi:hypothetical protein
LHGLRRVADRVVVLEPNGAHLVRKLLELTPAYRAAGEDSFRHSRLERLFAEAGYRVAVRRRFNLFPNLTPPGVFRLLRALEPLAEATSVLRALCTADIYGLQAHKNPPARDFRQAQFPDLRLAASSRRKPKGGNLIVVQIDYPCPLYSRWPESRASFGSGLVTKLAAGKFL